MNQRSMRDTQTANEKLYGAEYIDPANFRKTEMYVYVFSVVDPRPRGQKLHRSFPPLMPHLEIPEIEPGQRYRLVTKIGHPVNQYQMRENGERYIDSHDARRLAQDIVNPDNLSLEQDIQVDPARVYSQGNDYGRLGVFWSLLPTPKEEEIEKAIQRKEDYYRARLQEARKLEMTNPRALYDYLQTIDHIACDYFGEEYSWHKKAVKPAFCPNCGEAVKPGVAFHMTNGAMCVIDWKKTVSAGVKKREDVPLEQRWWGEKASRTEQPPSS
jgi:hypothetical protein